MESKDALKQWICKKTNEFEINIPFFLNLKHLFSPFLMCSNSLTSKGKKPPLIFLRKRFSSTVVIIVRGLIDSGTALKIGVVCTLRIIQRKLTLVYSS